MTEIFALSAAATDPDVRLMLAVREDDGAAFEELMLRYQTRVVNILQHLTGRREQAEDLAQDVFLRVYRARKTYQPEAKFSTWLFTIVNNVANTAQRKQSLRREVHLDPAPADASGAQPLTQLATAPSGSMPARRLDKHEMCDIVRLAVSTLSERQRMAVLLNKFEDMSYAEIAAAMQLSPEAIKSLLTRARVNLRQVLEPYLTDGASPSSRGGHELRGQATAEKQP